MLAFMKGYQDLDQVHSEGVLLNFAESQKGPLSYDGFEWFKPRWLKSWAYWNI